MRTTTMSIRIRIATALEDMSFAANPNATSAPGSA